MPACQGREPHVSNGLFLQRIILWALSAGQPIWFIGVQVLSITVCVMSRIKNPWDLLKRAGSNTDLWFLSGHESHQKVSRPLTHKPAYFTGGHWCWLTFLSLPSLWASSEYFPGIRLKLFRVKTYPVSSTYLSSQDETGNETNLSSKFLVIGSHCDTH